jgi:phytoene synthase
MQDVFAYCQQRVRETDKDRFLSALFAPGDKRGALWTLYAFDGEIHRVREAAREPMPGEIRLQWWRDVIEGQRDGEAAANPVAAALLETIAQYDLPRPVLLDLIDARSFDLYNDPMPTLMALQGYSDKTRGAIVTLAAKILSGEAQDKAAHAAGFAITVSEIVVSLPRQAARGQVYLPADLMQKYNADPANLLAGKADDGLRSALAELIGHAQAQLSDDLPVKETAAAFLPVAIASAALEQALKNPDPLRPIELSQLRKQWILWRAARNPGPMF